MAMIPQVDISVTLNDMGYAVPFTFDTGSNLYTDNTVFGIDGVSPGASGVTLGGVKNVAHSTAASRVNYALGDSRTNYATVPAGPFSQQGCLNLNAGSVLVMDIDDIGTTGDIGAKMEAWPGIIDYSTTGMSNLVISNQSIGMAFIGCVPIILDDATFGFCISGLSTGTGILPAGKYILIVKPDLSTSGWLTDEMSNTYSLFASCTWLSGGSSPKNYQVSRSSDLPTITVYDVAYNFVTGQTAIVNGTGDVSSDAANAFGVIGDPNTGATFITDNGIFGIDSVSGNDTGCWYCALDCSAFGKVAFVMPDASIGPSSSPTVYDNFNGTLGYQTYPQVDASGHWWWIRLALCDGSGTYISDPLNNEVYSSSDVPPPATGCPVAWLAINEPGNTLTPTGAWTARENEAAAITLKTFDSRATTGGIYDANLSWGSCTGVNQGTLIALTSANAVDLVQSDSDAQTGSFSSFNLAFPLSNAAGNTLIVDIAFAASTYTAGPTSVTDSQGNTYTKVTGGHPAFQGWFLETWIVPACAAGANTVTVSIAGLFPFTDLSIAIHEYAGVSAAAQVGDYGAGPLFGTGSPVNLSVTATAPALLHLSTATTTACPGATVGGGGNLPNVWTDQSHRLHVSESITISWIVRQRGTAHIPLTISGDDDYMPTIGSQVCLWDITDSDDFEVFSGTIDDFEVKWNGQTGQRIVTLTCVSLEQVFDTIRLPNLLFENKTAGFIFTALFAYASGSPVTLGTVGAGATIANFQIADFPSIADAFTRLATLSEYVWGVDPGTGSLYFTTPNTTPSPFTLDAEDVLWEQFTLKEERHDYRNWQGVKVSDNVAVQSSELFVGAGQSSFTMLRPIAQITNAWLTQNIQNFATGTFTGQPSPGDTISFGFTSGWTASEPIGTDQIIVDENGYAQKCTVPGTTGLTEPVWVEVYGEFTTDNTVQWQNQGIAGFGSGLVAAYTFVTALDNTQFGQVLIGATLTETIQNLADAINAIQAQAGITFSLPTWENPEVNADEPPSSTQIIVRNKPAGSGFVTALHETCANFSWSSDNTTGGLTTFGTDVITFGVRGQTTGGPIFTIVYTPGSNIVTSATPLDAGNRLQIQYRASDAGYVIVENTPEVETRAAIEGGTGKYQQTSSDDQALSLPEALQLAQQQLAAFGIIPQTFQFTCMRAGLYVGQVLTIVMENPSPALTNADWFIQEIQAEVVPIYGPNGVSNRFLPNGGHFKYTITCIDVAQIGSWIDFWLGLGGGSSGGGSFAGSGALGPGGASASSYSQTFVGITTLTVTHGLNTENVVVGVYDGSGNMVIPSSVQITGANTVDLVFGVATSGRVVIIGGQ